MEMWKSLCSAALRTAIPTFPQPYQWDRSFENTAGHRRRVVFCHGLPGNHSEARRDCSSGPGLGIRVPVRFRRVSTVRSVSGATRTGGFCVGRLRTETGVSALSFRVVTHHGRLSSLEFSKPLGRAFTGPYEPLPESTTVTGSSLSSAIDRLEHGST